MKISDLDYLKDFNSSKSVQAGLASELENTGIVISNKNGKITLFEDGIKLFSYKPKRLVDSLLLKAEGVSGIFTQCQTITKRQSSRSICKISFESNIFTDGFRRSPWRL
jgi:hypothetical protein